MEPLLLKDRTAIAGIGQTAYAKSLPASELVLACQAIKAALADAGILPSEVADLRARVGPPLARLYRRMLPWNLSRDFLPHIVQELVVIRADGIGWSDLGTPESVDRTLVALGRDVPWRSDRRRVGA